MATKKKQSGNEKTTLPESKPIDNSPAAKAARFTKIAGRRTKNVINILRNIGNTSNKNVYAYTDKQITYIFDAIEKQLKLTREKFAEKQAAVKTEFKMIDSDTAAGESAK